MTIFHCLHCLHIKLIWGWRLKTHQVYLYSLVGDLKKVYFTKLTKTSGTKQRFEHCLLIVWNHPSSASVLLCLNSAIIFKQHPAIPNFKHIEIIFVYVNVFPCVWKLGWLEIVWKNWHRLKTLKRTHCWGDSTQLVSSVYGGHMYIHLNFDSKFIYGQRCRCDI